MVTTNVYLRDQNDKNETYRTKVTIEQTLRVLFAFLPKI